MGLTYQNNFQQLRWRKKRRVVGHECSNTEHPLEYLINGMALMFARGNARTLTQQSNIFAPLFAGRVDHASETSPGVATPDSTQIAIQRYLSTCNEESRDYEKSGPVTAEGERPYALNLCTRRPADSVPLMHRRVVSALPTNGAAIRGEEDVAEHARAPLQRRR